MDPAIAVVPLVDKPRWGAGPWVEEPDRVEWTHAGRPCLALRNHHGAWCGYAAVPPGHPYYGADPEIPDVRVHRGLTYAARCEGPICHVPAPGEPDDVWWFGFDCSHFGDYIPGMAARLREIAPDLAPAPYDHAAAVAAASVLVDQYRPLAYVTADVNRLAEALAGAGSGGA